MTERLVVRVPGGQHHDFPIKADVVSVGRAPDCDLVLDYSYISRVHARIERQGSEFILIDSGSTNGTYVNGRRVDGMQVLASGDEIVMGDISIGFMQAPAGQATTTFFRPASAGSPIRCDSAAWQVWVDGHLVENRLSLQEFELLSLLSSRFGRVCTREELGTAIWGRGNYDLNMLHRLVHRLKQKLGPDGALIVSVAGKGYKLIGRDDVEGSAQPQFRTVLFTDLVGHTEMMQRLGDAKGRDVLRVHERITRETLEQRGGVELKTDGDSFMVSFASVTSAIDCAVALQKAFAEHNATSAEPIAVRMGLNAGEPIEEDGDLFGSSVILAARIAAEAGAGEILIPEAVRHLLSGKSFTYGDRGELLLKGFEHAVRLYEIRWRD